jgi:flagellar motility protein MotE (MotC chaperone)
MLTLLQSKWSALVVGILLYGLTTAAALLPRLKAGRGGGAAPSAIEAAMSLPPWSLRDPEVDQLVSELKSEREAVAAKEKQLKELDAGLQKERLELYQVTQSVYSLQCEFDKNVTRVKDEEIGNLKKLAKIYAEMSPESAALVFRQMEDPAVVKILMYMKDAETAPILEGISKKGDADAKRVANLTERLRLALRSNTAAKAK